MGPCKPESIEELLKGASVLLSQPCPDARMPAPTAELGVRLEYLKPRGGKPTGRTRGKGHYCRSGKGQSRAAFPLFSPEPAPLP